MQIYNAREYRITSQDITPTGRTATYLADTVQEAVQHCQYTENLSCAGWIIGKSGRTVNHPTKGIGWAIVKAD